MKTGRRRDEDGRENTDTQGYSKIPTPALKSRDEKPRENTERLTQPDSGERVQGIGDRYCIRDGKHKEPRRSERHKSQGTTRKDAETERE